MGSKIIKYALSTLVAGVCLCALFAFLKISVSLIPISSVELNAVYSLELLNSNPVYPVSEFSGIQFDGFTTKIMINSCLTEGDPLSIAFGDGGYARYWHGYLIVLKPLLMFFNIDKIGILFMVIGIISLVVAISVSIYKFEKQLGILLGICLCISYLTFDCIEALMCPPYFFSIILSIVACIAVIMTKHRSNYFNYLFFFIIGSLTTFFDFLDTPILTLCMPLVILTFILETGDDVDKRDVIRMISACCIGWILGYGLLWISKWILASMLLNINVFEDATNQVLLRSGMQDENLILTVIKAIGKNLLMAGPVYWVLLLSGIVAVIVLNRKVSVPFEMTPQTDGKSEPQPADRSSIRPYLFVGLIPYVWYIVLSNHSSIHCAFTYRDQASTLFALLLCALTLIMKWKKSKESFDEDEIISSWN